MADTNDKRGHGGQRGVRALSGEPEEGGGCGRVWVQVHVVIDFKQHNICGQLFSYPFSFCSALLKHNSPHHFLCSMSSQVWYKTPRI